MALLTNETVNTSASERPMPQPTDNLQEGTGGGGDDAKAKQRIATDTQQFINKGTKMIHSEQTRASVLKTLTGAGNPLEKLANTTVGIVSRIDQLSRKAGVETHDMAKIGGAFDLLKQLSEVGSASKAIPKLTEEQLTTSFSIAVEKYISSEIRAGRIDPDALKEEMAKGIKAMPKEEQLALNDQLNGIHKTAMETSGQPVEPQQVGIL